MFLFLLLLLPPDASASFATYCLPAQETLDGLRSDISPFLFIKDQAPRVLDRPQDHTHCLQLELSPEKEAILSKIVRERHPNLTREFTGETKEASAGSIKPSCRIHLSSEVPEGENERRQRWVYAQTKAWTKVSYAGCSVWLQCHLSKSREVSLSVSLSQDQKKFVKHVLREGEDWTPGLPVPESCPQLKAGGLRVGLK